MARKAKVTVDKSARPPLKCKQYFFADRYLMYLIQEVTKLPSSDILGFFADLGKAVAEEGVHFMFEHNTSAMVKKIFDFFPGTSIPYSLKIEGNKIQSWSRTEPVESSVREAYYTINVGFPAEMSNVDQTALADIIMEKAILGACDMPNFEKPDPKCPKMYKDLMREVQGRRMV